MAITIMILCAFLFVVLNVITLQVGYLLGKNKYKEEREDKYWDMCRQIALYDDELRRKRNER